VTLKRSSTAIPNRSETRGADHVGLILDSSVVVAAERRPDTVEKLIEQVISVTGDQDAAL
jgi:hypothetical protein